MENPAGCGLSKLEKRVGTRTRTEDLQNHNLLRYQLRHTHHGTVSLTAPAYLVRPEETSGRMCPGGFEPPTLGLEDRCSIQLSYGHELSIQSLRKAGDGNRTHISSLEGWCSTTELHPHDNACEEPFGIGVTGFEPATSWSQTRRSSQTEPHPGKGPCFVTRSLLYSTCQVMSIYFCLPQNRPERPGQA